MWKPTVRSELIERVCQRWILYGKSFNLKAIFKAILATLERIIRLFSQKWPKSPWEIVFKFKLFSYKIWWDQARPRANVDQLDSPISSRRVFMMNTIWCYFGMFFGLSCGCRWISDRRLSYFYPKIHQNRIHHEYSPRLDLASSVCGQLDPALVDAFESYTKRVLI